MRKIIFILTAVIALYSCEKDGNYLTDGGTSNQEVGTTTMEFFKSHSQLDTLAILIERAGMEDLVNGNNTIFAPNNLSIKNYVKTILAEMRYEDPQAEYTINDIPLDTLTKYMGGYIIPGKIKRENMTLEQGKIYIAENGEERRISLEPTDQYNGELDSKPEYVYFTYKQGEDWDPWDDITDDDKVVVKTSNLISTNGVIHVLQGNHTLFNYERD